MYKLGTIITVTALVLSMSGLFLLYILRDASVEILLLGVVLLYYIVGLMIVTIFWIVRQLGTTGSGEMHK